MMALLERLFIPLLPPVLYGMRPLGQRNLVTNSLCFIGLLLVIQFVYLKTIQLALTMLKWCSLRWTRGVYWRLPLEMLFLRLLPTLQTFPLQLSPSCSQALPPSSSDAQPSSSVITFNFEDHDPPTEMRKRWGSMSLRERKLRVRSMTSRDLWEKENWSIILYQLYWCHFWQLDHRHCLCPWEVYWSSSLYWLSFIYWLYFNFSTWSRLRIDAR